MAESVQNGTLDDEPLPVSSWSSGRKAEAELFFGEGEHQLCSEKAALCVTAICSFAAHVQLPPSC